MCNFTNRKNWAETEVQSFKWRNHLDEVITPISVKYSSGKSYFGFRNLVKIFDITRPDVWNTFKVAKTVVSAIGVNEEKGIYAAGCYNHNLYIYDSRSHEFFTTITGHPTGITQVNMFGNYALVGTRKDTWIYMWDLRNDSAPIQTFYRDANTQQRMYFSSTPNHVITGSTTGSITLYSNPCISEWMAEDTKVTLQAPLMFDAVPCVQILDSSYPVTTEGNTEHKLLWVAGSGQRHFESNQDSETESEGEGNQELPKQAPQDQQFRNGIRVFVA